MSPAKVAQDTTPDQVGLPSEIVVCVGLPFGEHGTASVSLQSRVCVCPGIALCPKITLGIFVEIKQARKSHPRIDEEIDQRMRTVRECNSEIARRISRDAERAVMNAFLINGGGWFIYLLPIAGFLAISGSIMRLVAIPIAELNRIIPDDSHHTPRVAM